MQTFRRGAALLLSLSVVTLALAGCHHADNGGTDNTGHVELNGTDAVATINGQDITQQQFFTQLQNYVPPQNAPPQPAGQAVLRQMIAAMLVEQLAKDQGVAPTDAEVTSLYDTFQAVQSAQSVKPFDQLLAESGQTAEDIKDIRLRPQIAEIKLLTKGQAPISDADISAFYAQNKAQYTKPDRAHIKRIVVANGADAKRIFGQIQQGQSFDSLVSQSLDRTFPGGDVPVWVNLDAAPSPALVPPPMVQLINKAKPGDPKAGVVGPYSFHGVYWIVDVVEKKPKEVVPLDQVKDSIRFTLMAQRAGQDPARRQAVSQQLRDYQTKAKITVPDPRYAQLLAQLTAPPPPAPTFAPPAGGGPGMPRRPEVSRHAPWRSHASAGPVAGGVVLLRRPARRRVGLPPRPGRAGPQRSPPAPPDWGRGRQLPIPRGYHGPPARPAGRLPVGPGADAADAQALRHRGSL